MKFNLGSGADLREGYVNVDLFHPCDLQVDLSKFPWPFVDGITTEVLMLDFLEHFPYRETDAVLQEVWRIMKIGASLIVQVPDFDHCSRAILGSSNEEFQCNKCGEWFTMGYNVVCCKKCGQHVNDIQDSAIHRLYGGQDRIGNWHFNAFTEDTLRRRLRKNDFRVVRKEETNENGESFFQNWNIRLVAEKVVAW